jgi:hypothetical protein
MITRREFLELSAATGMLVKLSPSLVFASSNNSDDMTSLSLNQLQKFRLFPGIPMSETQIKANELLNSRFTILYDEWDALEVELIEVNDGIQTEMSDHFSLVFHTMWEPGLDEDTYIVEHPELGRFPLFITPIEHNGFGYYYEVTVNRILTKREMRLRSRATQ